MVKTFALAEFAKSYSRKRNSEFSVIYRYLECDKYFISRVTKLKIIIFKNYIYKIYTVHRFFYFIQYNNVSVLAVLTNERLLELCNVCKNKIINI